MDKRIEIYKLFANQICNELRNKISYDVKYSYDGNKVEIWLHGYPLYPSKRLGDVIISLPINYISVQGGSIRYNSINQASVGFYQENTMKAFAHPHVWNSGQPCWDHVPKSNINDLFVYIVNSLLLTNVTKDSLERGHPCPDSIMVSNGGYRRPLQEIYNISVEHSKFIQTKLGLNIRELELSKLFLRFNSKFNHCLSMIIK